MLAVAKRSIMDKLILEEVLGGVFHRCYIGKSEFNADKLRAQTCYNSKATKLLLKLTCLRGAHDHKT